MMASLLYCAPSYHSTKPLYGPSHQVFTPSLCFNTSICLHLRSKKDVRVAVKHRLNLVFASNKNLSEGSDDVKVSESTAQGPPFLTILAGLVVFGGICWIIGSVVVWLFGLIVHPPPLK